MSRKEWSYDPNMVRAISFFKQYKLNSTTKFTVSGSKLMCTMRRSTEAGVGWE